MRISCTQEVEIDRVCVRVFSLTQRPVKAERGAALLFQGERASPCNRVRATLERDGSHVMSGVESGVRIEVLWCALDACTGAFDFAGNV